MATIEFAHKIINMNSAKLEKACVNLKWCKWIACWENCDMFFCYCLVIGIRLNECAWERNFKLNCLVSEWNWTNWDIALAISGRFLLSLNDCWMIIKSCLMSSAKGNSIGNVASPIIKTQFRRLIKQKTIINCKMTAIVNRIGPFVSNGNLCISKRMLK